MEKQRHINLCISFYFQVNYTRWLCYCHVPVFCDSLPRFETTIIFGRTLLRSVFQTMRRQLLDKFRAEKDKMPPEKRTLVLTHFPRYVILLNDIVNVELKFLLHNVHDGPPCLSALETTCFMSIRNSLPVKYICKLN